MSTKRQNILNDLKADIATLVDFAHVEVNRVTVIDLSIVRMPACFIYSGDATPNPGIAPLGEEAWDWEVWIEIWGRNVDIEDLYGKVHNKVMSDVRRNMNAIQTEPKTVEAVRVVDTTRELVSLLFSYNMQFTHPRGQM